MLLEDIHFKMRVRWMGSLAELFRRRNEPDIAVCYEEARRQIGEREKVFDPNTTMDEILYWANAGDFFQAWPTFIT